MKEMIDVKGWPIVTIRMESEISTESMQFLLDGWSGWLDKNEPFGMLFLFEGSENKHSNEIKKMRKAWLKANRHRIGQTVAGVAMVLRSSALLHMLKPIAGTVAKKMFGCSARVFSWAEHDRASDWLKAQINDFN